MGRRGGDRLVWVAAAAVLAAACGVTRTNLPTGVRVEAPAAYHQALEAATRTARVYDDFEHRLSVTAVLETPAFLDARFEELGRVLLLTPAERVARRRHYAEAHPGPTAVIFVDGARKDVERLDDGELWHLTLEVDGEVLEPTTVEGLDEEDPNLVHLFPWSNAFGSLWVVTFAAPTGGEVSSARLRLGSATARLELDFGR